MNKLLVNLLFLCFNSLLISQGMYFKNGTTGYGFSGSYESEDISGGTQTTLGANASYFMNNIGFGVGYASVNLDDDLGSEYDLNGTGLSMNGNYHIRNETLPVNFLIGAGYSTMDFNADVFDDLDIEASGTATRIGGGIYKELMVNEQFSVTGFFNYNSITAEATLKDSYGTVTSDDEGNLMSFGAGILLSNNFFIQPQIERSDDYSGFSLVVGLIVPNK